MVSPKTSISDSFITLLCCYYYLVVIVGGPLVYGLGLNGVIQCILKVKSCLNIAYISLSFRLNIVSFFDSSF